MKRIAWLIVASVVVAPGRAAQDDTAMLQALLDQGRTVTLDARDYFASAPLRFHSTRVTHLDCRGGAIVWTAGTDGLVLDGANVFSQVTIQNCLLVTTALDLGTALAVSFPYLPSYNEAQLTIENVGIGPRPSVGQASWATGIALNDVWNASIGNVWIHGRNGASPATMTGIVVGGRSIEAHFTNVRLSGLSHGWVIEGDSEGALIDRSFCVRCDVGVYAVTPAQRPWLSVTSSHFAVRTHGIYLKNRPQAYVAGNLIYRSTDATTDFVGVYADVGSNTARVVNNEFVRIGAVGASAGVVIAGHQAQVIGNVGSQIDTLVWIKSGGNNGVYQNVRVGGTVTLDNDGTGTRSGGNSP